MPAPGTASCRSACCFFVSKLCRPETVAACPSHGLASARSDLGRPRFADLARLVPVSRRLLLRVKLLHSERPCCFPTGKQGQGVRGARFGGEPAPKDETFHFQDKRKLFLQTGKSSRSIGSVVGCRGVASNCTRLGL